MFQTSLVHVCAFATDVAPIAFWLASRGRAQLPLAVFFPTEMLDWSDEALQVHTSCTMASATSTPMKTTHQTRVSSPLDVTTSTPVPRHSPTSGVKLVDGPWERHERMHANGVTGKCDKCFYARNRRNWFRYTPLDAKAGVHNTWLCARPIDVPDSTWGVGCRACSWAAQSLPAEALEACMQPYANILVNGASLRLCNLKRHAQSSSHQVSVKAYLLRQSVSGASPLALLRVAPPTEAFKDAWLGLRKDGIEMDRKRRTLEWCLLEAVRDQEREFLATATCISIMLDERNGRLLIKYSATNKKLDVRVGCLGLVRDAGGTSRDVAVAVHTAVSRFCTSRVLHPGINAGMAKPDPNQALQDHIRNHIEMFTADGASNEQLAGKMLHPTSLRGDLQHKLPALRLVIRDKAHATRRITERTISADSRLNHIMDTIVLGPSSVSRILRNSRPLASIFEEEVSKQERMAGVQSSMRNMSFAKQRFDSTAKPLGRCLLNLDATISTMDIICARRGTSSPEHKGALGFLQLISQEANLILLGMLADACDECLVLTRFFDREAFRLEEMVEQIDTFKRKLKWLFAGRGCLDIGYTSVALTHLRKGKLVPIPGQSPVTLGGHEPSQQLVIECLGHMVAWSNLATEVATTEFPDFELLACFQVFKLADPLPAPATAGHHLQQLADAFKVQVDGGIDELLAQFLEHQRITLAGKVAGEPAAASWQRALQKTQMSCRRRKAFPVDMLAKLLQRFVVSPGSTSGIEQNFSMFKRSLGQQWNGSELSEERRLVLQLASSTMPDADTKLLAAARLIWATVFRAPRARNAAGTMRSLARKSAMAHQDTKTATAWLRRRRQHVDVMAKATPIVDQAVEDAAKAAWTHLHDKEVRFQKKARLEIHCAAVQQGVVAQHTLGEGAREKMHGYQQETLNRETQLVQKETALRRKLASPQMPDLRGGKIFVDTGAADLLNQTPAEWALALRRSELTIVQDRVGASVFCVLNPGSPGDRVRAVASLIGGVLCTPELLLTGSGVALKLQRAIAWPRHIFLTVRCYDRHRVMIDVMQRVCRLNKSRWTWYLEADGADRRALFLDRARKRQSNHTQELVTLLVDDEQAAFGMFPNRMTLSKFLGAAYRVDARFTWLGICGR